MPTTLHPPPDALAAFALGQRIGPEVESHLAECDTCAALAASTPGDRFLDLLRCAGTAADGGADTPSAFDTQSWATPAESPVPGDLRDHPRYRLERVIGAGGMGTVWLAEHRALGRWVAVKVIRPDLLSRPGAAERFQRESKAVAKLSHPNIVTVHDADRAGNTHFLVMEYVVGQTLAAARKSGLLTPESVVRHVRDAALGLAHAHVAGLVHRDVKPHNLMLADDGRVTVLDFGLATVTNERATLTGEGMLVGTPDYIAPEQIESPHAADARSDIYSLGCSLYHLLAGRVPFPANSVIRKLDGHRTEEPAALTGVPPALAAVVAKMMAKRPADRYQTASEIAAALEPFVADTRPKIAPARRSRYRWAVAVALGVLAAAAVAVVVAQVIIVRDKAGKEVARVEVSKNSPIKITHPDGSSVEFVPGPAAEPQTPTAEPFRLLPVAIRSTNWSPTLSADGKRILVPRGEGEQACDGVTVYDTATGEVVADVPAGKNHTISDYAFTADGKRLVAAVYKSPWWEVTGTLKVIELATKKERIVALSEPLPRGWAGLFSLSADGKRLAFVLDMAQPKTGQGFWAIDTDTGKVLRKPGDDTPRPSWEDVALTADGSRLVVAQQFRDDAGRIVRNRIVIRDLADPARTVSRDHGLDDFSYPWPDGDGGMLAKSVGPQGEAKFVRIDVTTGALADVTAALPLTTKFTGLRTQSGPRVLLYDPDRKDIQVFDLRTKKATFTTGPVGEYVRSAISDDGRTLAVWAGKQVRLYRVPEAAK